MSALGIVAAVWTLVAAVVAFCWIRVVRRPETDRGDDYAGWGRPRRRR